MATTVKGDEARGQDDDVGNAGLTEKKVEVENSYFEKLRARLGQKAVFTPDPDPDQLDEPKNPGFVIYGDDGRPIG